MPKYMVTFTTSVSVYVEVEAEDREAAIDAAEDEIGGLTGYVGNGGTGRLIGPIGSGKIEADGELELFGVEEMD